jgi:hypothetical protein
MANPFNEGKACDAVIRYLETHNGGKRQDVRLPDKDGHLDPVELTCLLNGRLFAFEHTGIEPFEGQIQLGEHAAAFFKPIIDKLSNILPHTELYELYVPVDATRGLGSRDISGIQDKIIEWICAVAPMLPFNRTGRLVSPQKNVSVPGIPFPLSLYRHARLTPPGVPIITFHVVSSARKEEARRDRIETGYNKKMKKLSAWKRDSNARTVLIFEDNDIQLTNPSVVTEAVLDIVARATERPDEIHLVTSCVEPWWVSPVLVDSTSSRSAITNGRGKSIQKPSSHRPDGSRECGEHGTR